jgi:hypothetical protein
MVGEWPKPRLLSDIFTPFALVTDDHAIAARQITQDLPQYCGAERVIKVNEQILLGKLVVSGILTDDLTLNPQLLQVFPGNLAKTFGVFHADQFRKIVFRGDDQRPALSAVAMTPMIPTRIALSRHHLLLGAGTLFAESIFLSPGR